MPVAVATVPPARITTGAASGWRDATTLTVGVAISVTVRLALDAPPDRYSVTVPPTATSWPTVAEPATFVNTYTPSEVAGSASGHGSWNQKPFEPTAVTTPRTPETLWVFFGDRCAPPLAPAASLTR